MRWHEYNAINDFGIIHNHSESKGMAIAYQNNYHNNEVA